MMGPCMYCGRLTDDAEKICSKCQQRKQEPKVVKSSKLDYWRGRADELALKSGKVQVVVDHGNGSCQVWPKALVSIERNIIYETGGGECA